MKYYLYSLLRSLSLIYTPILAGEHVYLHSQRIPTSGVFNPRVKSYEVQKKLHTVSYICTFFFLYTMVPRTLREIIDSTAKSYYIKLYQIRFFPLEIKT